MWNEERSSMKHSFIPNDYRSISMACLFPHTSINEVSPPVFREGKREVFLLECLDSIHEAQLYAVGIIVLQMTCITEVVLAAYISKEDTEVLVLHRIILYTTHVAKTLAIVLSIGRLFRTCGFVHALEHQIPMWCKLPVSLCDKAVVVNITCVNTRAQT